MTNPSISSKPSLSPPEITASPGYRSAEAFVRPSPLFIAGKATQHGFDLRKCEFTLKLTAAVPAKEEAPTVAFLPDFHFPKDTCTVEVSSGKWEISGDDEDGAMVQKLYWWYAEGEQSLKVGGLVRPHSVLEGTVEEMTMLQQCQNLYGFYLGNCIIM